MEIRDRAFLREVSNFTYMNHLITASILQDSLGSTERIVRSTLGSLKEYDTDQKLNEDAIRMLRIVTARIYAETISVIEDFGALGVAIRKRENGGIFKKYLGYGSDEVKKFYKFLLDNPTLTPSSLLNIPKLTEIAHNIQQLDFNTIKQSYETLSNNLSNAAKVYSKLGSTTKVAQGNNLETGWENDVNIILDLLPSNDTTKLEQSNIQVLAYNKTKHGFMVTENLSAYDDPSATHNIVYGRFSISAEFIKQMLHDITAIALTMAELASLILLLEDLKVIK